MTPEELAAIKSSAEDGWATSSKDTLKLIAELESLQNQIGIEDARMERKLDKAAAELRIAVDEQLGRVTPQWVFNIAYGGNKHG